MTDDMVPPDGVDDHGLDAPDDGSSGLPEDLPDEPGPTGGVAALDDDHPLLVDQTLDDDVHVDDDLAVDDLDDDDLDDVDLDDDDVADESVDDAGPDDLSTDGPDDLAAGDDTEADRTIDLDDGDAADTDDGAIELSTEAHDGIDLSFDDDSGGYGAGQIDGLLADLDVPEHRFDEVMGRLGLHDEADARSIVVTLEQLDVVAHVEFADVDRLVALLDGGAEIRLSSGHVVVEFDDRVDEVVVERGGVEQRLALGDVEHDWERHSFEAVVTDDPVRSIVLLPVSAEIGRASGGISG